MWLRRILIVLSILSLLLVFTGILSRTSGVSMLPTLQNDDLLIVVKTNDYDYNDIVIVHKDYDLVKRVVGKSGDTIKLDSDSSVIRNDELLDESYIKKSNNTNDTIYTVSNNAFFVLGDNRGNSKDSRTIGDIKPNEIRGKVVCNLTNIFGIRLIHFRVFQLLLIVGVLILSIDWRRKDDCKIKRNCGDRATDVEKL